MVTKDGVQQWLIGRICKALSVTSQQVNGRTTLDELGIDSLTRVGLAGEIEEQFNVPLDPDDLYDFRYIQDLAEHVVQLQAAEEKVKRGAA